MQNKKKLLHKLLPSLILLLIWQGVSLLVSQNLILASPLSAIRKLFELMSTITFYRVVMHSTLRIMGGFVLSLFAGISLAIIAYKHKYIEMFLQPVMDALKATPVASFIILLLIMLSSKNVALVVVFIISLPVIYINVFMGIKHRDDKMLELARVYKLSNIKKIKHIYLPSVKPYLISAIQIATGMAWKAGATAEVIALPQISIGEALYNAKIYISTEELFAWTIVIVILGMLWEKLIVTLTNKLYKIWREVPK